MSDHDRWQQYLLLGFMFTLGAVLCWYGLQLIYKRRQFVANAHRADGKVVRMVSKRFHRTGEENYMTYAPVVQFQPAGGRSVEFTGLFSSEAGGRQVGDTVSVLYDPQNPADASIEGTRLYVAHSIFYVALGLAFVLSTGFFWMHMPASENKAAPRGADLSRFTGNWVNEAPETAGITRMEIGSGRKGLDVRTWGQCGPVECERDKPQTMDLSDANRGVIRTVSRPSFATETEELELLTVNRLRMVRDIRFTARSRQRDSHTRTEYFKRK